MGWPETYPPPGECAYGLGVIPSGAMWARVLALGATSVPRTQHRSPTCPQSGQTTGTFHQESPCQDRISRDAVQRVLESF